jgi:cobyric acid synthase CobQ/L-threonine-O-3-phosphate decarboxylase
MFEHGGNIHKLSNDDGLSTETLIDFSANINPLGPPPWLRSLINRNLHLVAHYPDPDCTELVEAIASRYRVAREAIIPANGTSELLNLLPFVLEGRRVIIPVPCYLDYLKVFMSRGFEIVTLDLAEQDGFGISLENLDRELHGGEVVIFGNPVNPSGAVLADDIIVALGKAHPDTLFVVDEAFHEFARPFSTVGGRCDNIITINSLTKFFGIPGLRIGFGIFPHNLAEDLHRLLPPWSVNSLAQQVGVKALQDDGYCLATREKTSRLRVQLTEDLKKIAHLQVFPSAANYLLIKLGEDLSGEELYRRLLERKLVIRRCNNYRGLDDSFIRIAVKSEVENLLLIDALADIIRPRSYKPMAKHKRAATIMFQGTSSNAGKSVLAAALCRILLQDGFSVCPFKAQNMSLNSHVTRDGGEMGRAQVVQAQAAKLEPDWRMNPILLKPNSDTGSQVIVNGRPVANMNVRQYHAYKQEAWKAAAACFDELRSRYEVLVLEGAGSPGEINLKKHDIVNMKMARYAAAPVLLVGDIDRGGVYASFAGIMDVLEEWERDLIKGFVVNKFRGDQSLLDDAHRFIFEHTGRPVMGVVPYMLDITIPQEDSVSLREGFYRDRGTRSDQVEIAVIDLPHISNFTDIDPLYHEPDVNIRFITEPDLFGNPDAVILPGSKNVAGDIVYLRKRGLDKAIVAYGGRGGHLVGICGGYQILGHRLRDPHGLETSSEEIAGLELLQVDTVLAAEKTLERKSGIHLQSGMEVIGYEIHHGLTQTALKPVLKFNDGRYCGGRNHDGSIWGAYLHGLFDRDEFRRWFIDSLRIKKSLPPLGTSGASYNVDKSLDELADLVRASLDMKAIYKLMGLSA